jgi:hypothetical protein
VLITLSLPSSLEEVKLMTLFVSYDGSYEDDQGKRQYLVSTVLKVVQSMKEGQKVFIIEEKGGEMEEERRRLETGCSRRDRWGNTYGKRTFLLEVSCCRSNRVVKMADIFKGHHRAAESTHGGQQPRNHTVMSECSRPKDSNMLLEAWQDADRGRLENHGTDQQRQRGRSPVPPAFFKTETFDLLLKLWGPRLCPESMNDDVRKALEETHYQLPIGGHQLLCIGSWQFQSTESDPWEFYRFTFHEKLETERHKLFSNIRRSWNEYTREEFTTEHVTQRWRTMIVSIFE